MAGAEVVGLEFGLNLNVELRFCLGRSMVRLAVLSVVLMVMFIDATNTSPPRRNLQVENKAKVGKTINVSCQSTSLPVFPFVLPGAQSEAETCTLVPS